MSISFFESEPFTIETASATHNIALAHEPCVPVEAMVPLKLATAGNLHALISGTVIRVAQVGDGKKMCSERDCSIFRGMITACDACEKKIVSNPQKPCLAERMAQIQT
jgi:hypothetical protein